MAHRIAGGAQNTEYRLSFQEGLPQIALQSCRLCPNQEAAATLLALNPRQVDSVLPRERMPHALSLSPCNSVLNLSLRPGLLIRETKSCLELQ